MGKQGCTWTDFSRGAERGRKCKLPATHRHRLNAKCPDLARYLCAEHSASATRDGIVGELIDTRPAGFPANLGVRL